MLTESSGELEAAASQHATAAEGWASYGDPAEEAYARIGAGRCLASLGRAQEALSSLRSGGELAAFLKAQPLVDEAARWARTLGS